MKLKNPTTAALQIRIFCLTALLPLATAQSATTDLAQVPLYTTTAAVPPNIFFLNDDSNSMEHEMLFNDTAHTGLFAQDDTSGFNYSHDTTIHQLLTTVTHRVNCTFPVNSNMRGYAYILETATIANTEACGSGSSTIDAADNYPAAAEEEWRVRFYETNKLYYNPNIEYFPWPDPDPSDSINPYGDMSLNAARIDPNDAASTIDLTSQSAVLNNGARDYYSTTEWKTWCKSTFGYASVVPTGECIGWRYYERSSNGNISLTWVKNLTDEIPIGWKHSRKVNFANWFTYHRSRKNVAKSAIGKVVDGAVGKRLGYGAINDIVKGLVDKTDSTMASDIAYIADNNNTTVLNKVYNTTANGDTPLQKGLDWVGKYYEIGETGDAGNSPILSAAKGGACQINNTVLITDGFYTNAGDFTSLGNIDGDNGSPYSDLYSNNLADIAMHYYERDLALGLDNKVGPNSDMPQHMNTYTISLGLDGNIKNPDMKNLTGITWGNTKTDAAWKFLQPPTYASMPERIDDLFHAAVNGHGNYFQAKDPGDLAIALSNIMVATSSGARNSSNIVATSSFKVSPDKPVITTSFDSTHWSGTVKATSINADGTTTQVWSTDNTLPFGTARQIITYDSTANTGIPFTGLLDPTLLSYLRGQNITNYRERSNVLGDIINSSPTYVGAPSFLYPDADPFGAANNRYSDFWYPRRNREAIVYVGANDGMLHGFSMVDGKEVLAYVPNSVFSKLNKLADPTFDAAHEYFVDQTPIYSDAYFGKRKSATKDWYSVLVGGLGAGGRGLFALDITNPNNFSETNASSLVLWEFTNANDPDLGYTLAKPVTVMTEDKKWVVISGNGYGSDNGQAALFIIDLDANPADTDGWKNDYVKIAVGSAGGNALFSTTTVDSNGNGMVDRIYAGDLQGNLWVFVFNTSTNQWDPHTLFSPKTGTGTTLLQPITSRPAVMRHPTQTTSASNKPNLLILFGTGKYLTQSDLTNTEGQSFYAVWDKGIYNLDRTHLTPQTVTLGHDTNLNTDARLTGDITVDYTQKYGWYIDLQDKNTQTGANIPGERVVTTPILYQDIVFFSTFTPSEDPCTGGGTSWVMYLKANNGGPTDEQIVSLDGDLDVDGNDLVNIDGTPKVSSGFRTLGMFGFRLSDAYILFSTIDSKDTNGNTSSSPSASVPLPDDKRWIKLPGDPPGKRLSWRELRRE